MEFFRVCRWVALLVLINAWYANAEKLKILAVVDEDSPEFKTNLEYAVDYVNTGELGIFQNHTLDLEVLMSRDNDSFGAMDLVCNKLQSGSSIILDLSSRFVTMTLRSLAEAMGIMHVSAVDPSYIEAGRQYNTSLNIEPPASYMLRAIRDIVSQENLTNVGIIYDETFDLEHKPKRLLSNILAQHLYLRMAKNEDIDEQLEKIKSTELSHLFLVAGSKNAGTYLSKAGNKRMMTFKYTWYVLTKASKLQCSYCTAQTTAVVLLGNVPASEMRQKYVDWIIKKLMPSSILESLHLDHENIEITSAFQFDLVVLLSRALEHVAKGSWNQTRYTDCYLWNHTDTEAYSNAVKLRDAIKKHDGKLGHERTLTTSCIVSWDGRLHGPSAVARALSATLCVNYSGVLGPVKFKEDMGEVPMTLNIYRNTYQEGDSNEEKRVGNWSREQRLMAFGGSIADKTTKKTYRVITLREPPFVFKERERPSFETGGADHVPYYDEKTSQYFYGYCIDLLFHINKTLQFDFVLLEPPDSRYGSMQPNGTWDGMINELVEDRADIIVAPLSVMAERENVIDFTVPYYDLVGITILMKKPKFEYSVFKFMSVLEEEVWACVFSAFILVSILLWLFDKYSPYSYQNNKDTWDGQGEEPRIFTLKEGLWFCMTSLTPQGGGEAPRALSGRLVAATWWMFGFIMIATYTANLAAFLTVSRLDQPIESLDDLAKQFKTKYAPQESSATQTYFRRMADIEEKFYSIWKAMSLNDSLDQVERAKLAVWDYPVSDKFTNMWAAMKQSIFPSSFDAALKRVTSEEEDFAFIGDATQNKYATLTNCDLWEVGEEFSRKPYALAVQEGSPLKNELSSVILQLLNRRVLEDLKSQWWDYRRKKCDKIEDESDGISIYNIGGVFLVIFIGIGLGLITLGFEFYWYKWRPGANRAAQQSNTINVKEAHNNGALDIREEK